MDSEVDPGANKVMLVDAHVHLHRCFDLSAFLNHAAANFGSAALRLGLPADTVGCLMFTESHGVDRFQDLLDAHSRVSGWELDATSDGCSLFAHRSTTRTEDHERVEGGAELRRGYSHRCSSTRLVVVAGRQVATAERLEVLALATRERFPDRTPLDEAIDRVIESGAVCVLPWGFGKWTGRRGRHIEKVIESPRASQIFLGDNSGRLAVGPRPRLFRLAEAKGIPLLPGTDPFPLSGQVRKPGGYGFVLPAEVDEIAPARQLRLHLSHLRSQPRVYGRLERIPRFVHNQLYIQLSNRWTASA